MNALSLCILGFAAAVDLDLSDSDSIKKATQEIAGGVMDYYAGYEYGGAVGVMMQPYYWWESASAFNGIYTYGLVTGDTQYEDLLYDSLLAQAGDDWDFITANQSNVEGNDDQGYWAIFTLEALERNFKAAPSDRGTWLQLAQNVFDQMTTRWDPQCGGGLRWQIFDWNHGYEYKNSVSTGCMFNIAARLARYTNNQTYVDWAYKIYDWMIDIEFITLPSADNAYHIYDGSGTETNCTEISTAEWSYNYGLFLSGMAYLYDVLGQSDTWSQRVDLALTRAEQIFFNTSAKVMIEPSCQPYDACNNDQRSFRGPFARFLGHVSLLMPDHADTINSLLEKNAGYAAKSCSGGSDGKTCGQNWGVDGWDGVYGLGEELSALEVIINTQIKSLGKPNSDPQGDAPHEPESESPASSSSLSSAASSQATQSMSVASPTSSAASTSSEESSSSSSASPTPSSSSSSSSSSSETPTSSSSSSSSSRSSSEAPSSTSSSSNSSSSSETATSRSSEAPSSSTSAAPTSSDTPVEATTSVAAVTNGATSSPAQNRGLGLCAPLFYLAFLVV